MPRRPCMAIRHTGGECGGNAMVGEEYCRDHKKYCEYDEDIRRERVPGNCLGNNDRGYPCRKKALRLTGFCKLHSAPTNHALLPTALPSGSKPGADKDNSDAQNFVRGGEFELPPTPKLSTLSELKAYVEEIINETRFGVIDAKQSASLRGHLELVKDLIEATAPSAKPVEIRQKIVIQMVQDFSPEQCLKLIQNPTKEIGRLMDTIDVDAHVLEVQAQQEEKYIEQAKAAAPRDVEKDLDLLFGVMEDEKDTFIGGALNPSVGDASSAGGTGEVG